MQENESKSTDRKKYPRGRLIKVTRLPEEACDSPHVIPGDQVEGYYSNPPTVGECFTCAGDRFSDYIRTSTVVSILKYDPEQGLDKLVLPKAFQYRALSEISNLPELQKGDYLFSTLNSIYLLRPQYGDAPIQGLPELHEFPRSSSWLN